MYFTVGWNAAVYNMELNVKGLLGWRIACAWKDA